VPFTAIGGTQRIQIRDATRNVVLDRAFTASTDGAGLQIVEQGAGTVELHAVAHGGAVLRIESALDGTLFDKVGLKSRALDHVELHPGVFREILEQPKPGFEGLALWRGTQTDVVVALYDVDGNRLVDDSMELASIDGEQAGWDVVHVVAGTASAVALDVTIGGATSTTTLPIADAVASVTRVELEEVGELIAVRGQLQAACFTAIGDRGGQILNAPWRFTVTGPVAVSDVLFPNCVGFRANGAGTVTVTATAAGMTTTATDRVVESARRVPAQPRVGGPLLGERAAATAATTVR